MKDTYERHISGSNLYIGEDNDLLCGDVQAVSNLFDVLNLEGISMKRMSSIV